MIVFHRNLFLLTPIRSEWLAIITYEYARYAYIDVFVSNLVSMSSNPVYLQVYTYKYFVHKLNFWV